MIRRLLLQIVHEMELRAIEKKDRSKKKVHGEGELTELRPAVKTVRSDISLIWPYLIDDDMSYDYIECIQVVALTSVPVGGSVMSLRDEKGHETVLIGYSRYL